MPKEKTLNPQQSQQELRDAYYDFIAACMINEAYETEENNLDEVLKELKDVDLDGLKEFASEFYHDELANLLSIETLQNYLDSETPLDLLNSAELDEKVMQEYTDHLYDVEKQNDFQKAMTEDAVNAYRVFIYECMQEELSDPLADPAAYEDYNRAFNDLQTLEQLRDYANNYADALKKIEMNYAPYGQEYDGPDMDNILVGWYYKEQKYAELGKLQMPFSIKEELPEAEIPEEMTDKEKEETLKNVNKFFDELHKTEEQEKVKAAEEAAMEKLRQLQQKDQEIAEQERITQEKQSLKESKDKERLDRERAKQEKEQEELEKRIKAVKKADEKERKDKKRFNKMRKQLESRKKKQEQLKAEELKREEVEKKAALENEKRRQLEELLKEEMAAEITEKEPEDVIDESLGGKSLEELGVTEELLKRPPVKIEPAESLEMPRRSKTVDSFNSKLVIKTDTLNAAVFKDELRRLAKDLEKTVHIGQSNTQGFKDLQAALKELRETKGDFKEETVSKEAFMKSDLIQNTIRACSQYAFDHTEKTLDATQMQRLKIMSRMLNTVYMAEKDIEPNSIAGMKEKLSEKYNNAKCIAILKSSKSTPEQKKEAKYAMLSFTTIGDKGHNRSKNAMKSIEAKFKIDPARVPGAMMQTLKKPGAEFMKEIDGQQNVNKAQKSKGVQK